MPQKTYNLGALQNQQATSNWARTMGSAWTDAAEKASREWAGIGSDVDLNNVTYTSTGGQRGRNDIYIDGKFARSRDYDDTGGMLGKAAPIIGLAANFIPGVGPLASAAINAGLQLANGADFKDVAKNAVLNAGLNYVGGNVVNPAAKAATDAFGPAVGGFTRGALGNVVNTALRGGDVDLRNVLLSGAQGGLRGYTANPTSQSLVPGGFDPSQLQPGAFDNYTPASQETPMDEFSFGDQEGDYPMPTTPDPAGNWWAGAGGYQGLEGTLGDQEGDYPMPTTPDPTGNWWENADKIDWAGALNKVGGYAKQFLTNKDGSVNTNAILGMLGAVDSFRNKGGQGVLTPDQLRGMVGSGPQMTAGQQKSMNSYFKSPLTKYRPYSAKQLGGANPTNPVYKKYAEGGEVEGPLNQFAGDMQAMMGGEDPMMEAPEGYVEGGPGGGQDDMVEARLSPGEYVWDADVVSALGDGSNEEGARILDEARKLIRGHKRSTPVDRIPPMAKSPLAYIAEAVRGQD